ncbi:MAG: formylglycine-generating enzyme family protein [Thermoplasmata archaeon]|nr:formylglycine-generating enzyme family protein [Thermoplasmata archaeon]
MIKIKANTKSKNIQPDFINSIGMKFKLIPSGQFLMGRKEIAEPIHRVKISRDFYMGMYQVTQREWEAVMETNPSDIKREDLPVNLISWNDSHEFVKKLNEKEFLDKKKFKYRLPTEAEWEYVCRAGSKTMFYFDHKKESLDDYIWHYKNSATTQEVVIEKGIINKKLVKVNKSGRMMHPVGQLKPNKFGLYDMHGNVFEWCEDWFSDYPSDAVVDPVGSPKEKWAKCRIFRGGSYMNFAGYAASAHRDSRVPDYKTEVVGLRLVKEL